MSKSNGNHGRTSAAAGNVDRYAVEQNCTDEEFLAAAKVYAREVVDRHDLTVRVSDLEWEVSKRAKRRAGAVKHRDGDPRAVSLTRAHFEERGWRAAAETIRHELIHVHLLNTDGDPSHGPAFERLAETLDTRVHCERFTEPNWWVTCENCGSRMARYRRSKLVRQPDQYACGDCSGPLTVTPAGDHRVE